MVKRGPCFHCGITYTPLWRNGPPEKPVLCNACGSRYRLRGHLHQYTPKHLLRLASTSSFLKTPADHDHKAMDDLQHILPSGLVDTSLGKSQIPRRRRSEVVHRHRHRRHQTHIERLQSQLLRLLKYDDQGFMSNQTSPSDGELLYDPNLNPCTPFSEIGLGVVILQEQKLYSAY